MVISNKFLNAANVSVQQRTNVHLYQNLKIVFPENFLNVADIDGIANVAIQRKEIIKKGIFTEKGIFSYLCIGYLLGKEFESSNIWQSYWADVTKIGDYAIDSFLNALNEQFGMTSPDDNGFGLSETAFQKLPRLILDAKELIISNNAVINVARMEMGRQFFLNSSATVVTKNPYNARISALNREIKIVEDSIYKLELPLQKIKNELVESEIEKINLNEEIARDAEKDKVVEHDHPNQTLLENNKKRSEDLQEKLIQERSKNADQLDKLMVKSKALKREITVLKSANR